MKIDIKILVMEINLQISHKGSLHTFVDVNIDGYSFRYSIVKFLEREKIRIHNGIVLRIYLKDNINAIRRYINSESFKSEVYEYYKLERQQEEKRLLNTMKGKQLSNVIIDFENEYPQYKGFLKVDHTTITTCYIADGKIAELFKFIMSNEIEMSITTDYFYDGDDYVELINMSENIYSNYSIVEEDTSDSDMCGASIFRLEYIGTEM